MQLKCLSAGGVEMHKTKPKSKSEIIVHVLNQNGHHTFSHSFFLFFTFFSFVASILNASCAICFLHSFLWVHIFLVFWFCGAESIELFCFLFHTQKISQENVRENTNY